MLSPFSRYNLCNGRMGAAKVSGWEVIKRYLNETFHAYKVLNLGSGVMTKIKIMPPNGYKYTADIIISRPDALTSLTLGWHYISSTNLLRVVKHAKYQLLVQLYPFGVLEEKTNTVQRAA